MRLNDWLNEEKVVWIVSKSRDCLIEYDLIWRNGGIGCCSQLGNRNPPRPDQIKSYSMISWGFWAPMWFPHFFSLVLSVCESVSQWVCNKMSGICDSVFSSYDFFSSLEPHLRVSFGFTVFGFICSIGWQGNPVPEIVIVCLQIVTKSHKRINLKCQLFESGFPQTMGR
jgi:hypothetical protein